MTRRPMPECCTRSLAKIPRLVLPINHQCETCGAVYTAILFNDDERTIIWTPIDSPLAQSLRAKP